MIEDVIERLAAEARAEIRAMAKFARRSLGQRYRWMKKTKTAPVELYYLAGYGLPLPEPKIWAARWAKAIKKKDAANASTS